MKELVPYRLYGKCSLKVHHSSFLYCVLYTAIVYFCDQDIQAAHERYEALYNAQKEQLNHLVVQHLDEDNIR